MDNTFLHEALKISQNSFMKFQFYLRFCAYSLERERRERERERERLTMTTTSSVHTMQHLNISENDENLIMKINLWN